MDAKRSSRRLYFGKWCSCDGLFECDVTAYAPDVPWPAMVGFELEYGGAVIGGTLTIQDAQELASHLRAAATEAALAQQAAMVALEIAESNQDSRASE